MDYREFFRQASGSDAYPYQEHLAAAKEWHALLNIPTGLGKTAAVVLAWLWRRRFADAETRRRTPRRLVYCLPMRVLVEQTRGVTRTWLERLRLQDEVRVHVLMGGEDGDDWDLWPERDAVLVGTQDMLLSRALNRGYGMSRYRWPLQFGLLHADCLWVFDEVQLMGAGLPTTAQLQALRHLLPRGTTAISREGHGCCSLWMSATLQRDWLETVDFGGCLPSLPLVQLTEQDYARQEVRDRWGAPKLLLRARSAIGDPSGLAGEVHEAHKPGTRTIVVVNTVQRACQVFAALNTLFQATTAGGGNRRRSGAGRKRAGPERALTPRLVLLHSRFRPPDRRRQTEAALAAVEPDGAGTIVVSTQVIEAGVDVSATTLFTELAPWASLVQRFGRCNREGKDKDRAAVYWLGLPTGEAAHFAAPYDSESLHDSARRLRSLKDVGPKSLPRVELPLRHEHVLRQKDLVDLFDTTTDLAGNDVDVDRFVREVEEIDAHVFWRDWDGVAPPADEPAALRDELCRVPIGALRTFITNPAARGKVFRRDFLEARWVPSAAANIYPGQTLLVHRRAGGYRSETGWDAEAREPVSPPTGTGDGLARANAPDDYDDDGLSRTARWQTIAQHTDAVCAELDAILRQIGVDGVLARCLQQAARWHDWGKAHDVFQTAVVDDGRPASWVGCRSIAKAPGPRKNRRGEVVERGFWRPYRRKHFRHELASALGVLHPHALETGEADRALLDWFKQAGLIDAPVDPAGWQTARDLVAYLIAAHHGRVRLSIRSWPNEVKPRGEDGTPRSPKRFARGIWDGDRLPQADLGDGVVAPPVSLSLEPMELGLCELPPFAGQPSWLERVVRLRDTIGPFRLAYFEALLRAADMRASKAPAAQPIVKRSKVAPAPADNHGD